MCQCEAGLWAADTVVHSRPQLTLLALGVFQTETSFVALSHLGAIGGQDIIVSEDVHTVVMPVGIRDKGTRFPSCPQQAHPVPSGLALRLNPLTHDTRATPRSDAQPWA